MRTRANICFVFRKVRAHYEEEISSTTVGIIYCRLSVRGKTANLTTGIRTTYAEWDSNSSRIAARTPAARTANESLVKMRDRLTDLAADLDRQNKPITAKRLRVLYLNNGATLNFLELANQFLTEEKTLIGLEISKATSVNHRVRVGNITAFLTTHKLTDLRPEEFTHGMADKLLYWLLGTLKHSRNYALKTLQFASQVLRWAVRRELLDKNPMELYRFRLIEPKEIVYLEEAELAALTTTALTAAYLERTRDCFVFQCWTGLAYSDMAALNVATQAETGANGRRFLRVRRAKSTLFKGYECIIPLLPEAERLLAKYSDKLPVPANATYNFHLKEVGVLVGIGREKMCTHVGRKTAGTLMLNRGIPIEAVSKFLGHGNIKITQKLYAKLLDKTVTDAFDKVFGAYIPAPLHPPEGTTVQVAGPSLRRLLPVVSTRPARRLALSVLPLNGREMLASW